MRDRHKTRIRYREDSTTFRYQKNSYSGIKAWSRGGKNIQRGRDKREESSILQKMGDVQDRRGSESKVFKLVIGPLVCPRLGEERLVNGKEELRWRGGGAEEEGAY